MKTRETDWTALVESLETSVTGGGWAVQLTLLAAVSGLIVVLLLVRRVKLLENHLKKLESPSSRRGSATENASINTFCQQLMSALQMEVPAAVSSRMSADDPARFARVLAIYTRAQRRKLVTLYNNAEALREQLKIENPHGVSVPSRGRPATLSTGPAASRIEPRARSDRHSFSAHEAASTGPSLS
ncbi:MAG: hypothetical protein DCC65_07145 [Planctomycetota bacterium]|nr:MAG: hypothetical protein DCC65_07145 [Planctomycetota bacterium]